MGSSPPNKFAKIIVDSVHGDIHLTEREVRVIDTASFQRLRRLKQLALAQMVYPNATHSRFAHSIGALGIMSRILGVAEQHDIKIDDQNAELLRLAALLHDIGHYPYSHLMEKIDRVVLTEERVNQKTGPQAIDTSKSEYPSHEEVGQWIVTNQPDLIEAIGGPDIARKVADLFARTQAADPQLSKLIHSSVDIDRMDYLPRDSLAAGVPYGSIDINYLLNNLKINSDMILGFSKKALPAIEHFLLARFFMHRVVYYHKAIFGLEEACRQLLRRLKIEKPDYYGIPTGEQDVRVRVSSDQLYSFTDTFVDHIIDKAVLDKNPLVQCLAKCIQNRRPPALLKEVTIFEPKSTHHAGKTFLIHCENRLVDLASKHHLHLGQFLLCSTPPLRIGYLPTTITPHEAMNLRDAAKEKMVFDEEEKEIRLFEPDLNRDPIALSSIEHSVVTKMASSAFSIYRLYVVLSPSNPLNIFKALRSEVQDWDQ
jgi:uncharacterized protein